MATIEERIYSGARAREILDNEVFHWVLDTIKQEIRESWEQSPARDCDGREKLWMMLSLANKLELMIKSTLETGNLAQLDLEHKRTILERVKNAMY